MGPGRLDDVVELGELLLVVDAFGLLEAVPVLVAEHPEPDDIDPVVAHAGEVGVDEGLVHVPLLGVAGARTEGEQVVRVGLGDVVLLAVQTEVDAATRREGLGGGRCRGGACEGQGSARQSAEQKEDQGPVAPGPAVGMAAHGVCFVRRERPAAAKVFTQVRASCSWASILFSEFSGLVKAVAASHTTTAWRPPSATGRAPRPWMDTAVHRPSVGGRWLPGGAGLDAYFVAPWAKPL